MKDYITVALTLIISVLLFCSCSSSNACYEDLSNDSVTSDLNLKYNLSLRNDSVVLCLTNDGNNTVYLFDSYINDDELKMGTFETDAIYRYDHDNKKFKISCLPLLPYLTYSPRDVIVFGPQRLIKGGQVLYSFRQIKVNETVCFTIPFSAQRVDRWYEDFDVRKYNKWDNEGRLKDSMILKKSENSLNQTESPKVYLELAVYSDTLDLSKDDYYFHEFEFNSKIKRFETLLIPLSGEICKMIFGKEIE